MATFPMIEDKNDARVDWYRSPLETATLRQMTRRSNLRGLSQAVGHLALVGITGGAAAWFADSGRLLPFLVILWLHGIVYSFIPGLATHELSHGTVFRSRALNSFFLLLYSLVGWTNPFYYKASHTYHHQFTLFRKGDGEAVLPGNPRLNPLWLLGQITVDGPTFLKTAWAFVVLALTGRYSGIYKADWSRAIFSGRLASLRQKAIWWARLVVIFHLAILGISILQGLWYLPLIVTVGPFIANFWRYFIGATMHTGLRDDVPDWRKCARTIKLDPFSRFLYWNMNFHIEHHMFAAVPCYNLPDLSRRLASDFPGPRTLVSAWREMRHAYQMQKTDPAYQYDTPVPGDKDFQP